MFPKLAVRQLTGLGTLLSNPNQARMSATYFEEHENQYNLEFVAYNCRHRPNAPMCTNHGVKDYPLLKVIANTKELFDGNGDVIGAGGGELISHICKSELIVYLEDIAADAAKRAGHVDL